MTIGEARAELVTALQAAGVRASDTPGVDTPYIYVTGDGTGDPGRVLSGAIEAAFRLIMVGGAWDDAAAARELDTLKQAVLTTVRDLEGWRFAGQIGPDGVREWQGGLYLQADAFANRLVEI